MIGNVAHYPPQISKAIAPTMYSGVRLRLACSVPRNHPQLLELLADSPPLTTAKILGEKIELAEFG